MSVKSSRKSLRMKPLLFVMLFLTAAFCAVRTDQLLRLVDPQTGFFTDGGALVRVFLYAVPVIGVLWVIVTFLSKDASSRSPEKLKSIPLALAALLLCAGLVFDAVQAAKQIRLLEQVKTGEESMFATGEFALIGEALFAALGVIYFALLASSYFGILPERILQNNGVRLLALSPMLWAAARLIHHFLIKISFTRVSDLFFELLMLGFLALFFLHFAQFNSNVYRVGFEWRLFGFGVPAAMIAGMLSVSRILVFFVRKSALNADYPIRPADCAFCIFAFVLLFALLNQPQESDFATKIQNPEEAG